MRNGPELWDLLLETANVKGAVIAGGCIRDYLLDVPPKDYDMFIAGSPDELEGICKRLNAEGAADLTVMQWNGTYDNYDDPLVGIIEGEMLGFDVNIIANDRMYHSPENLVEGFDYAVSQGYYALGMTEPVLSEAAQKDIDNRTATLVNDRTYSRSIKRMDRYNARNGGILKVIDPYQESFEFI